MSNLLQVVRSYPKSLQTKGNIPLILEFKVSPETAPYLVSSSVGTLWISAPHPGDIIKAAVRDIESPGQMFADAVKAVAERGVEFKWGNVHPYTAAGLDAAVDHVQSYDLHDIEILVGPQTKENPLPKWLNPKEIQIATRISSWIPENCAIVVPANREFVGFLVHLKPKQIAMAIHNASRAIGIVWDMPELEPVLESKPGKKTEKAKKIKKKTKKTKKTKP